jgi:hypothetical protein
MPFFWDCIHDFTPEELFLGLTHITMIDFL